MRLSAALTLAGLIVSVVAGAFHPAREPANDHLAVFAEYAADANWEVVHLGQFASMVFLVGGMLTLYLAIRVDSRHSGRSLRLGAASAVASLALYGVLQAVDGVALKQAVDALATATDVERPARFAAAETVRWLEWGVRAYHSLVFGTALICFATGLYAGHLWLRLAGVGMAVAGVGYLAQGWVVGLEGFSARNGLPTLAAIVGALTWAAFIMVAALQTNRGASSR